MKLLKLKLKNIFSYDQASLDLSRRFTLIQGPNGAGKSSIFEAISYAFFGQTERYGTTKDEIIRVGEDEGQVILYFEVDGTRYKITRGRTNVTGSRSQAVLSLRFYHKNKWKDVPAKTNSELDKQISELIGMSFLVFRQSIMFGQSDKIRFINASDSERKKLLGDILSFGVFDEAYKRVARDCKEAEKDKAKAEGLVEHLIETTTGFDLEDVEDKLGISERQLERLNGKLENVAKQITKQNVEQENLNTAYKMILPALMELRQAELKALQEHRPINDIKTEYDVAKDDINELKMQLVEYQQTRDKYKSSVISPLEGELAQYNKILKAIKRGKCSECGRPIDSKFIEAKHAGFKQTTQEHIDSLNTLKELNKGLQKIQDNINEAEERKEELRDELEEAQTHKAAQENVKGLRTRLTEALNGWIDTDIADVDKDALKAVYNKKLGEIEASLEVLEDRKEKVKVEVDKLKGKVFKYKDIITKFAEREKYGTALEEASTRCMQLESLKLCFGPRGARHKIVELVLPDLERLTNEYLALLDSTGLIVRFEGEQVYKSGSTKDALVVNVERDKIARTFESYSGGEKKKIMIASTLALVDITSRYYPLDFVLVDELFGALDEAGKRRLSDLLVKLSDKFSSIFVISHDELVQSIFDEIISVTMQDGKSVIEAQ